MSDRPTCPWFPDLKCDEICFVLGCGNQGELILMKASGVPQSEIGGPANFTPDRPQASDLNP